MLGLFRRSVPVPIVLAARRAKAVRQLSTASTSSNPPGPEDKSPLIDFQEIMGLDEPPPMVLPAILKPQPGLDTAQQFLDIPPAEDPLLHFVASSIMKHGRRHTASRSVNRMLLHLYAFTRAPPLPILREAVRLAAPSVKIVTTSSHNKNTLRPAALSEKQRTWFAIRWILQASEKKSGRTVDERLARELIAVVKGESDALKKKLEVHKFAMVNRYAFLPDVPAMSVD